MRYRTAKILAETNYATAATKTFDINIADIISRIVIAWRVSMVGDGMNSYAHKDITKIELVDGSEVLHSLDGGQNQALCIYDRKCPTMNHGQYVANNSMYSTFGIDFGRFLHDPVLAFDPRKFKNPQLKITFNFAVADTGATSGNLEIWAECFDEKIVSPIGFLTAKEYYAYTCGAANSYEYIDLPTDRVLRKMLIQGYYAGYTPWDQIIEAQLSEDNDKRIPFDWDLEDYNRVMKGVWTPVEDVFYGCGDAAGTYTFYLTPTDYYTALVGMCLGGDQLAGPQGVMPGGKFTLIRGATGYVLGSVRGYLPNHCFEFPFGDQMDMADWYDVTKLGSLRLRLKAGASGASGSGAVILQQLRKY